MKSKLEIHGQIFKEEAHRYHGLIRKAKSDFHKSQLENCNFRDLFSKINTLCKPKSAKILPSAYSLDIPLVELFSVFFFFIIILFFYFFFYFFFNFFFFFCFCFLFFVFCGPDLSALV